MSINLRPVASPGARVVPIGASGWRLEIPAGPAGAYRLAQLDDYSSQRRSRFPWHAPLTFSLSARASKHEIPGTWGFGLWNDPFGMGASRGINLLRLPALPNAAWFFFASSPNYLSLRDDLPARGGLAGVFRSPRLPGLLSVLGVPVLPLLLLPPIARALRRVGRRVVRQAAAALDLDPGEWHAYSLTWRREGVAFQVDGKPILETELTPLGPLGLVLWVDNQYASLPPDGRFRVGTLLSQELGCVEIKDLSLASLDNPPSRG